MKGRIKAAKRLAKANPTAFGGKGGVLDSVRVLIPIPPGGAITSRRGKRGYNRKRERKVDYEK